MTDAWRQATWTQCQGKREERPSGPLQRAERHAFTLVGCRRAGGSYVWGLEPPGSRRHAFSDPHAAVRHPGALAGSGVGLSIQESPELLWSKELLGVTCLKAVRVRSEHASRALQKHGLPGPAGRARGSPEHTTWECTGSGSSLVPPLISCVT